jgi:hypothetical protein
MLRINDLFMLTFHDSQILDAHVTLTNHLIAQTTCGRGLVGVLSFVFGAEIEKVVIIEQVLEVYGVNISELFRHGLLLFHPFLHPE